MMMIMNQGPRNLYCRDGPVFVTEHLAAILKIIYKRLISKTKNLLNIIQKAAENAKLKTSELPLTQHFFEFALS